MRQRIVSVWLSKGSSLLRKYEYQQQQVRLMVTPKSSNRASVHGTRLPVPDLVDKEEVEKEIRQAKEERENRRKKIENIIDSELKTCNKPYSIIE